MNRLDRVIVIQCPKCRTDIAHTVRWFFTNRDCPSCGADINAETQQVLLDLREAYRAYDEFLKQTEKDKDA